MEGAGHTAHHVRGGGIAGLQEQEQASARARNGCVQGCAGRDVVRCRDPVGSRALGESLKRGGIADSLPIADKVNAHPVAGVVELRCDREGVGRLRGLAGIGDKHEYVEGRKFSVGDADGLDPGPGGGKFRQGGGDQGECNEALDHQQDDRQREARIGQAVEGLVNAPYEMQYEAGCAQAEKQCALPRDDAPGRIVQGMTRCSRICHQNAPRSVLANRPESLTPENRKLSRTTSGKKDSGRLFGRVGKGGAAWNPN